MSCRLIISALPELRCARLVPPAPPRRSHSPGTAHRHVRAGESPGPRNRCCWIADGPAMTVLTPQPARRRGVSDPRRAAVWHLPASDACGSHFVQAHSPHRGLRRGELRRRSKCNAALLHRHILPALHWDALRQRQPQLLDRVTVQGARRSRRDLSDRQALQLVRRGRRGDYRLCLSRRAPAGGPGDTRTPLFQRKQGGVEGARQRLGALAQVCGAGRGYTGLLGAVVVVRDGVARRNQLHAEHCLDAVAAPAPRVPRGPLPVHPASSRRARSVRATRHSNRSRQSRAAWS